MLEWRKKYVKMSQSTKESHSLKAQFFAYGGIALDNTVWYNKQLINKNNQ